MGNRINRTCHADTEQTARATRTTPLAGPTHRRATATTTLTPTAPTTTPMTTAPLTTTTARERAHTPALLGPASAPSGCCVHARDVVDHAFDRRRWLGNVAET